MIVDLSGTSDTAKRGSETDTLTRIEGAIGSAKADTFKGDAANNEFQGGLGKDTITGGGGRDLYDFNTIDRQPGRRQPRRDQGLRARQDVIDLTGIDADGTLPGDQAFRWVGKAALTGAGPARLLVSRRQHHRPGQHRRRRRGRARDPAHRRETSERGRLPAVAASGLSSLMCIKAICF